MPTREPRRRLRGLSIWNAAAGWGDDLDRVRRDALLVVRTQLGDRRALAELVEHWHGPVWRFARRMLGGARTADDASQDAWFRALKALPRLREPERFAPWLYTIVRRAVIDHLAETYGAEQPVDDEPAVDDAVDVVLERTELAEGLALLPAVEREALILFHLQDMSIEECAQILQVPAGTVKSRLFRARRLLRDRLIERGYAS
jgi:RNA polymerase sigma factor (sigma-70 family)